MPKADETHVGRVPPFQVRQAVDCVATLDRVWEDSSMHVVQQGERVHVIRRPRVEGEVTRHFAGVIQAYDAGVARAEGYVIVYDEKDARYVRRVERRTRIFRLADPSRIINVVPEDVDLDQLKSPATEEGRSVVTDGGERRMELSGFHDKR